MPHVELSLTEDTSRRSPAKDRRRAAGSSPQALPTHEAPTHAGHSRAASPAAAATLSSLERWATAVIGATEPSLVLSADTRVVAASASCADLIALGDPDVARGQPLRSALGELVDFTASLAKLDNAEADKIPPLLAISSGRLARGLMRVRPPAGGTVRTVDAVATPLWDGSTLVGSLTFFSEV